MKLWNLTKSLSSLFPLARYEMSINGSVDNFKQILTDFLSKENFIVEHRDKEIDLSKAVKVCLYGFKSLV